MMLLTRLCPVLSGHGCSLSYFNSSPCGYGDDYNVYAFAVGGMVESDMAQLLGMPTKIAMATRLACAPSHLTC